MLQSTQKTKKRIAFDIVTLGLRGVLLCIEVLLKFTCNLTANNIYKLQVTGNILRLLILPATILYLFDSIDTLLKNGQNPKKNVEKIEVIAKKLAIIGLCLFILINVNYRAKFFFEEVFIRNKKANKDDYYVPLLDPTIVHYLFLTAAILFLVSSMIQCYSAYDKAYGSSNGSYEDKKSFYKSVCFLLLDLAIFLTETLGYELMSGRKVPLSPDVIYDFELPNVLNRIRDVFYLQSSFYSLIEQPGSSLDNIEITRGDGSDLSPSMRT
ncbi:hypothetical protein [Wolbachia endosymbiont of Folsomia candida]|uniref:hypothetical protein n=1 Tax=Wolbachia endosymbiont of Folsomia candida TaxID=169402 RepID=UPI000A5CA0D8|nr:hypothetical protein [Wolbachia endosymbiont of Folsomia candida]APR98167.1 hypothetical protein ASM33_02540 [Wolbachia endosymbiont of Folsomia candida]